jgi:hypothetical protein
MKPYIIKKVEAELWTVGFNKPEQGEWYAVSDHSNESEAIEQQKALNGDGYGWVYITSEKPTANSNGLWTVGCYSNGEWRALSDHETENSAINCVIYMNADPLVADEGKTFLGEEEANPNNPYPDEEDDGYIDPDDRFQN